MASVRYVLSWFSLMLLLWRSQLLVMSITESDFYEIGSGQMQLQHGNDKQSNATTLSDPPFSFYGVEQTIVYVRSC